MLWKTDQRWAGGCREFVLKLDDGSVHTALFEFAKKKKDADRLTASGTSAYPIGCGAR